LFSSLSTSVLLYYKNKLLLTYITSVKNSFKFYEDNSQYIEYAFKSNIKSQFSKIDTNSLIVYENETYPIKTILTRKAILLRIPQDICECFDPLFSRVLSLNESNANFELIVLTSNESDYRKFYGLKRESISFKVAMLIGDNSGFITDAEQIPTLAYYNDDNSSFIFFPLIKNDTILLDTFFSSIIEHQIGSF